MPDLRHKMLNKFEDPRYRRFWDQGVIQIGYADCAPEAPMRHDTDAGRRERDALYAMEWDRWLGDLFYVTGDMVAVAVAAAKSLPNYKIEADDLPSPSGAMYFAHPVGTSGAGSNPTMPQAPGGRLGLGIWALTWGLLPRWITDDSFQRQDVLGFTWWTRRDEYETLSRERFGAPVNGTVDGTFGPLIQDDESLLTLWDDSRHTRFAPTVMEDFERKRGTDTKMGWSSIALAAFLLMQQQIGVTEHLPQTRPQRRRANRAGQPLDATRVIRLRHVRHASDDGHSSIEYRHRWIVKGHWRNHWFPRQQRHVPLWIAPHVKGPDDAPFLTGEKVYSWER